MIFAIFAILIAVEIIISYKCLTVTDYKIKSDKIKETTKIVLISDLHNSQFGSKNKRLVDKIQKQDPDLILMDGDMLNEDGKNAQTAVELISALKKTAPVYYALGNHEIAYRQRRDKNLYQKLQKAGAKVVEKEYEDIKVRSNKIRIGGLYEYAFAVDGAGNMVKKNIPSKVRDFLMDYENTDAFKIMLSHRPDSFVFGQAADTWKIDLVVSGHVHGGQVRIPGKGGLYGGDQGWFPEYTDGIHHFKTVNHMIITRGLGSDKEKLPRFHNIPENFKKFLIDTDEEVQVEYFLEVVDKLPELDGECVSQRIDLKVYKKDNLEYRRMNFMGMEESYGQYEEISQNQVKLYLKREFVHMINVDTVFVSLFAMEKRMLAKDAMVLHCSVLKVKSGVILFSGPSGIGKSTQAGLWTKYRKARVINGDRTLLKKENGRWMSLGWPICGSSEICYNEAYPVKAVIFLGQAEENDGRRLRYFDAIKAMISQITVNGWNPQFVEKIWNLTEDFAAQIPVFEYGCNMEEAAVDTLENLLLDILE